MLFSYGRGRFSKEQALAPYSGLLRNTFVALSKNIKSLASCASFLGPFFRISHRSAALQVSRYSKDDLQRIFKTVLDIKAPISISFERDIIRPKHLIYIRVSFIWIATSWYSNAKITLQYSKLETSTRSSLPSSFSKTKLSCACSIISKRLKPRHWFPSIEMTSRPCYIIASTSVAFLWMSLRKRSKYLVNTS